MSVGLFSCADGWAVPVKSPDLPTGKNAVLARRVSSLRGRALWNGLALHTRQAGVELWIVRFTRQA